MMESTQQLPGKSLTALLEGVSVKEEIPALEISDVTSNSKAVIKGALFIALKGMQTHGIDFAIDAARAGAAVIMYDSLDCYCQQRIPLLQKQVNTRWLGIEHLDRVNGEIVSRFYDEPGRDMTIIGVTGTDGKSSVTHLITQALDRLGKRTGSIGTLGYGMGNKLESTTHTTPDAVMLQSCLYQFRQQNCEYVTMEVSSHALEQYRVNGCQFDIAVLTNLGRDHLDYHGDIENYSAAKSRLFTDFELNGRVINANDEFGRTLADMFQTEPVICYSSSDNASDDVEVRLRKNNITSQGQDMVVDTPVGEIRANTALMGNFNVDNTLACISSLISLGFSREEINLAVADLQPIPGRMETFTSDSDMATAVVDFAHTEQALRACLAASREHTRGKLWCIFGCGGDRDQGKRIGMGRAAEQLADYVIVTDDNPRTESPEHIVSDILTGMNDPDKVNVVHNRLAAIEFALSQAASDDLVVIAGKGHEQEQIIGHERYPFSDRHVVERIMRAGK
ncbi:MAG: UDP-N-acetylmuramoyl-L-alanyl-D-glutamate--2,6-diaminopimelate ligase [Gammaproteobacteria bacterium]|nr:UDP-N-acetylmuramoyl-L-alanyl-D-glutamate--2,6-diaminopimelate ligase [Gammaproteobacteria bacterium]